MGAKLILYSTDHCTLCEQALELLLSMTELAGETVRVVDVAGDDSLFAELAEDIPVLEIHLADGATRRLVWPFDSKTILSSIRQIE
jgi:hypothetical protein